MSSGFERFFLENDERNLSRINLHLIKHVCSLLNIETKISSSRNYEHGQGRTQRLLDLCLGANAKVYLSGPAAKGYLDVDRFRDEGIAVRWMDYSGYPVYAQLHGDFEHRVSIVDTLFNVGPEARNVVCTR